MLPEEGQLPSPRPHPSLLDNEGVMDGQTGDFRRELPVASPYHILFERFRPLRQRIPGSGMVPVSKASDISMIDTENEIDHYSAVRTSATPNRYLQGRRLNIQSLGW